MTRWNLFTRARVNPLVPVVVLIAGLGYAAASSLPIGTGIAVGAVLAYVNGIVLSRRVDVASLTGNVASALMVMQVGLLITLGMVAVVTIILIKISLAMAVACAIGFAATHLAILATFYVTQARNEPLPTVGPKVETKA